MNNDFEKRILKIEQELLALKTASTYASVRNAQTSAQSQVRTGTYRIEYENVGEEIFSMIYTGLIGQSSDTGTARPRTPQGNVQLVDVNTTYYDTSTTPYVPRTYSTSLSVISNVPVVRIARVS